MKSPHFLHRHHWRYRFVTTEFGIVLCECVWWKRWWYLVTLR